MWTGELSWRRLGVLVRHLPPESATKTALRNAAPEEDLQQAVSDAEREYGPWSQSEMLLAEMVDLLRWLQWAKTEAAEKKQPPPDPFPRPGVNRKPAAKANAQVINLLEYVRSHNGASPEGYFKA